MNPVEWPASSYLPLLCTGSECGKVLLNEGFLHRWGPPSDLCSLVLHRCLPALDWQATPSMALSSVSKPRSHLAASRNGGFSPVPLVRRIGSSSSTVNTTLISLLKGSQKKNHPLLAEARLQYIFEKKKSPPLCERRKRAKKDRPNSYQAIPTPSPEKEIHRPARLPKPSQTTEIFTEFGRLETRSWRGGRRGRRGEDAAPSSDPSRRFS